VELALWGEVERSTVTFQFEQPYNQISHNQNSTTKCKQKWVTGSNNITSVMIQQSKANAQFLIDI
jgi:flagellar hook-basal body complex protein FliE